MSQHDTMEEKIDETKPDQGKLVSDMSEKKDRSSSPSKRESKDHQDANSTGKSDTKSRDLSPSKRKNDKNSETASKDRSEDKSRSNEAKKEDPKSEKSSGSSKEDESSEENDRSKSKASSKTSEKEHGKEDDKEEDDKSAKSPEKRKDDNKDESAPGKSKSDEKDSESKSKSDEKDSESKSKSDEKVSESKSKSDKKESESKSKSFEKDSESKSKSDKKESESKSKSDEKVSESKSKSDEKESESKSKSDKKESESKSKSDKKESGSKSKSDKKESESKPKDDKKNKDGVAKENKIDESEAHSAVKSLMDNLTKRDGHKKEFIQAAEEILESLEPLFQRDPSLIPIAERMLEPERVIQFRVAWVDDEGKPHVNRGWRVQYSSTIGPYKGGLRFHPSVSPSVLEFLGLEQILKNSLTGLSLGGGKGGSDFDPKGKSDNEVMRFCQQFMTELYPYIGDNQDVPAGDMGVGAREIGYMFGAYKKLTKRFESGVLTGKNIAWGGSRIRQEATGYGVVYFAEEAVKALKDESLEGKRCVISGSGNVALHCAQKLVEIGAVPITLSDSSGYILEEDGFSKEQIDEIIRIKEVERGRIEEYTKVSSSAKYFNDEKPWGVKCDYAFPCATQNELEEEDAKHLSDGGCLGVFEGANMPSTSEAIKYLKDKEIIFGPGKACNAGGVAVSGLEMVQSSMRLQWESEEVDKRLKDIMKDILKKCVDTAEEYGRPGDLQFGANVSGFLKVGQAMRDQGVT